MRTIWKKIETSSSECAAARLLQVGGAFLPVDGVSAQHPRAPTNKTSNPKTNRVRKIVPFLSVNFSYPFLQFDIIMHVQNLSFDGISCR